MANTRRARGRGSDAIAGLPKWPQPDAACALAAITSSPHATAMMHPPRRTGGSLAPSPGRVSVVKRRASRGGTRHDTGEVGLRVLGRLPRYARPARRQGRQRRRDDPGARQGWCPPGIHGDHRGVRRVHARGPRARRAGGAGRRGDEAARGDGRQALRRRRGSAARIRAQRRARIDAGHARHDPERGAQRHRRRGAGDRDRQRAVRVGLLPPAGADVRQRGQRRVRREVRGRDRAGQERRGRGKRHRAVGRRAQGPGRDVQGLLRLPGGSARAARARDPRGVRVVDRRSCGQLSAHQPDPRRMGDGRQCAADGVREHGRQLGHRRRVQPRRGDRCARAVGRFPRQRPGRGRRLRRAHSARPARAART